MKSTSIASLALLALVMTWSLDCRVEAQPRAHVQCKTLCSKFSKKIPSSRLKSYKKTDPSCPKAAVIFVTQQSKEFCANPEESWVKEEVRRLDQRNAALDLPPSTTVSSAAVQDKGGVFHKLIGVTISVPRQAGILTSPIPGAGATLLQAVDDSGVRAEESSASTPTVRETIRPSTTFPSTLNETGGSSTIHTESTAHGSNVSIRFGDSADKSTGSEMSPATDMPATVPIRYISYPTTAGKRPESPTGPTYRAVGSSRNQTVDVLDSGPNAFTVDSTALVNGTEIVELSSGILTTTAPLESVPSKPSETQKFHTEPTAHGSNVSIRAVNSADKSTGSAMSPPTDMPATVPVRHISYPTTVIKRPENPTGPTYRAVGSSRNQTVDVLDSGPSAFTVDSTAIVNGTEIVELSSGILTTTAPLESVPSKPSETQKFHTEPTAHGSNVSIRAVDSADKSTGSAMSPATDMPATVPVRHISYPTTAVKRPENPTGPTYRAVSSSRNQPVDVLDSGPSPLTADATALVNGTEIVELSSGILTTTAPLESVPSKPSTGLASLGQGSENFTMKPTSILKDTADATKGSTPPPSPSGGDMGSVSQRSGDERDAVLESMVGASSANYLSSVGREDPPHSSPESISPAGTSVFSFTRVLHQNRAQGASASPDVLAELTPRFLSAPWTHTLSLALLGCILCICSIAVWMYAKYRDNPEKASKEMVQGLLFHHHSQTNDYTMEAV